MTGIGDMGNPALSWTAFFAVGLGGAMGCWLRWLLAVALNHRMDELPMGTLVANLVGGFLIGLILGAISHHPEWPVEWRLFLVTGFLGGLTTFSTFSAEAFGLIERGQFVFAALHIGAHLLGSIGLCAVGFFVARSVV
jgi:fluoride exporter